MSEIQAALAVIKQGVGDGRVFSFLVTLADGEVVGGYQGPPGPEAIFDWDDVDLLRSAGEFFNTTEGRFYIDTGEFDDLADLADRIERLLPPREEG
jgi:hypothetical protein